MTERDTFKYPEQDRTLFGRFRDRLAYSIATFALRRIATPWYAAMIGGSIRFGLDAARREALENALIHAKNCTERNAR